MAHSKEKTLSSAARLKYIALLLFSYALLLTAFGFRLYEDASIPPWSAFLKYQENFQRDHLAQ